MHENVWGRMMFLRAFANRFLTPAATSQWELLLISSEILRSTVPGVVVECGCFKGGSTATLSVACRKARRRLNVFDSFCGLPEPTAEDQNHTVLSDSEIHQYQKGAFSGSLETVKRTVSKHGAIDVCRFWPGYFEDTLPQFKEPVAVAFCDVDLVESLKTCVRYLWPLMPNGATLFTHEAHHLEVAKLFHDDVWWEKTLAQKAPGLIGAGSGLGLGFRKTRHGYYGSCLGMIWKNPEITRISDEDL
jgi:macrocin-O-methyltransferase TylF-like protien